MVSTTCRRSATACSVAASSVSAITDCSAQPGSPNAACRARSTFSVVPVCETALAPASSETKSISSFWTDVYLRTFCLSVIPASSGRKKPIRRRYEPSTHKLAWPLSCHLRCLLLPCSTGTPPRRDCSATSSLAGGAPPRQPGLPRSGQSRTFLGQILAAALPNDAGHDIVNFGAMSGSPMLG